MKYKICLLILLFTIYCLAENHLPESEIHELVIAGPLFERYAEISGLTWYNDWLIILPQYPHLFGENGMGALFYLEKEEIRSFLNNQILEVVPKPIHFICSSDYTKMPGFEGFEAIAFHENTAYLTIETSPQGMLAYLGKAEFDVNNKTMDFQFQDIIPVYPQANIPNASEEAIFIKDEIIHVIYEANGKNVNPEPKIHLYNLDLQFLGTTAFPNLEYRITDATEIKDGEIWMLNYFWPGDEKWYNPAHDFLKEKFGYGKSHEQFNHVERLVAFSYVDGVFQIAEKAPVYLLLETEEARNWEGIVRFDDGFLIATDKHPRTILAFVKRK